VKALFDRLTDELRKEEGHGKDIQAATEETAGRVFGSEHATSHLGKAFTSLAMEAASFDNESHREEPRSLTEQTAQVDTMTAETESLKQQVARSLLPGAFWCNLAIFVDVG